MPWTKAITRNQPHPKLANVGYRVILKYLWCKFYAPCTCVAASWSLSEHTKLTSVQLLNRVIKLWLSGQLLKLLTNIVHCIKLLPYTRNFQSEKIG